MKKLFILITLCSMLLWASEKFIYIDLDEQIAYAYEDQYLLFSGRISSGKIEHRTPTGEFKVLEKKRYHRSNLWPKPDGGAKMHYMLRLNYEGIAMHLGVVGKYPLSHGCVRMENGFAQQLWKWAEIGVPVEISGYPPLREGETRLGNIYDDTYSIDP